MQLQARTKQKKRNEANPFSTSKTRKTLERRRKKIPEGKDPNVPVLPESQKHWYSTPFSEEAMATGFRIQLFAHTRMPTPQVQKWMQIGGCVCKQSQSGIATIAITLEKTRKVNCVLKRRSRRYVFSTIYSREDRMATNKDTIQCATLPQCGETLP